MYRTVFFFTTFVVMACSSAMGMLAYNLNVQVVQVCDDAGASCTALGPTGGGGNEYLYQTQIQEIWNQVDIGVTFLPAITWNNSAAQQLTSAEQSAVYDNTFTSTTGNPLPALGVDTVQIFFVKDHPGTGYDGMAGTGWVANPLPNPATTARNAGNAQLFISGTFASNGRAVMANEGFASDSLSGTIAHEIGHLVGLRHVEDVTGGAGAGTTQDPTYPYATTDANLMWGSGLGPNYDNALSVANNFLLNQPQRDAAIFNGLALDADGNSIGVLQAVPEPSAYAFMGLVGILSMGTVGTKRVWSILKVWFIS